MSHFLDPRLSDIERARLEHSLADLREAVEMLGDLRLRRRIVVEACRRVLPIYAAWRDAQPAPAAALEAMEHALPDRVADKPRAKLKKALSAASKEASRAAGYDRKTGRDRDPAARAANYVCMALDGALERYETFETVTLGFVTDALEHSGAGLAAIEVTIAWATTRARELGAGADEGWPGEIAALAKKLVPQTGEADTRQGEVVRCLGNLADEAMRNGNVNFGDHHREMVAYLRMHLAADPMWNELDRTTIERALTNVARGSGEGVDRASHRILARFGVRWSRAHSELLPR